MRKAKQYPVTPKDRRAHDNGVRAGRRDALMGYRSVVAFRASYSLRRYYLYYGAGYRNGWCTTSQ